MTETQIPVWLSKKESMTPKLSSRGDFLEKASKSIMTIISRFEEEPFPSFATKIDVRIKTLLIAILLFFILFSKSLQNLFVFFLFSIFIYALTKKSFKKVFPFILISLIFFVFVSPFALTNLVVKGEIIFVLFKTKGVFLGIKIPSVLGITKEGFLSVCRLFLRSFSSLLLTLFLFSATPLHKFLRDFFAPSSFKIIFLVMFFNIKKLLKRLNSMLLANISRSPLSPNFSKNKEFTGFSISQTFLNSLRISEEVYLAMSSKCWNRKTLPPSKISWGFRETISVFSVSIFLILVSLL